MSYKEVSLNSILCIDAQLSFIRHCQFSGESLALYLHIFIRGGGERLRQFGWKAPPGDRRVTNVLPLLTDAGNLKGNESEIKQKVSDRIKQEPLGKNRKMIKHNLR